MFLLLNKYILYVTVMEMRFAFHLENIAVVHLC